MSDDAAATAAETIESYYDALRAGEPLGPFFADAPGMVKFGIAETLVGADDIADGLRHQTETTTDWIVRSRGLSVTQRDGHAWFHDDVLLAWTDTESGTDHEFETRWSGTLESNAEGWQFTVMHVSTPHDGEL